jgi:hypothetical protein
MSFGNRLDAGFVASTEIASLEKLVADLRRIVVGEAPSPDELASAPLLLDFQPTLRLVPCLRGDVVGHPEFGNRNIFTSQLWAYSPRHHWCRTLSRFYRLGVPHNREALP